GFFSSKILLLFMTYPFLLEFKFWRTFPTGYVIYFFKSPSNTTFEYNSNLCQFTCTGRLRDKSFYPGLLGFFLRHHGAVACDHDNGHVGPCETGHGLVGNDMSKLSGAALKASSAISLLQWVVT
ncbi:MAG: hypothetical protein V1706_13920, partial [Pseudomonadota bacterium]